MGLLFTMRKLSLVFIVLSSWTLAACGIFNFAGEDDESDIVEVSKKLLEKQVDKNDEPIKIDFPLRINYSLKTKALLNEDLEIEFEFIAESDIPKVRIAFETTDGLVLVSNDKRIFKDNIKANEVFTYRIIVVPEIEEQFYVHVYAYTIYSGSGDTEEKRAKLLRIPIPVGQYKIESKIK